MATVKKLNHEQIQKIVAQLEKAMEYLEKEEEHMFSANMKVGYAQGTCKTLLRQLKGEWPL